VKNPPLLFQAKVSEFEAAREALASFRNKNAKLIDQHEMLRNAYNSALKEAKAEYKKNADDIGDQFGEFRITKRTDIDAELLLKLMPNADACVNVEYKINREEYNKLVRGGHIPQEVVEQVESIGSISVYGPKEA
jgi:hypothetical protein